MISILIWNYKIVQFLFIYFIMENWNVGVRYDALTVTEILDPET